MLEGGAVVVLRDAEDGVALGRLGRRGHQPASDRQHRQDLCQEIERLRELGYLLITFKSENQS